MKTVMVFGTFDGVHPGHEYFLEEAKKLGDRLVVCIARDSVVAELKGREPRRPEIERREALAECTVVDEVFYGDRELGSWKILAEAKPDVIALGYDQTALKEDLEKWITAHGQKIETVTIASHRPDLYKSSLIPPPAGDRSGRASA
jgi:FAD synthetase